SSVSMILSHDPASREKFLAWGSSAALGCASRRVFAPFPLVSSGHSQVRLMPVLLACPGCGRRLKVKDDLVGRAIRCPHCRQKFRAPEAKPEAGGYAVQRERPRPAVLLNPEEETDYDRQIEEKTERPSPPPRRTRKVAIDIPPSELQTASWVRHLHWLLALALLPLAISLLHKDPDEANLLKRLAETVKEAPADVQQRTERVITGLEEGKGAVNDLFDALPNHRLSGALLPRRTLMH